ncbi:MAG: PDZ domain-containing protein [Pirellulales bacterium]
MGIGDGIGVGLNNSPLGDINVRTGAGAGLLLGGFTSGNIIDGTSLDAGGGVMLAGANTPVGHFSVEPTPGVQLAVGSGSNPGGVIAGGGGQGYGGGTNGGTAPDRNGATTLGGGGNYGGGGVVIPGGSGNTGGGSSTVGGGGGNSASSGFGGIVVPGGSGSSGGGNTPGSGGTPGVPNSPSGDPTTGPNTLIGGTGGNSGGSGAGGIVIPGPNSGSGSGNGGNNGGGPSTPGNTLIGGTGGNDSGNGAGGIVLPGTPTGQTPGGGNGGTPGTTTIGGSGGNPTGEGTGGIVIPGTGTTSTPPTTIGGGGGNTPGGGGEGGITIPGVTTTTTPGTNNPPGSNNPSGGSLGSSGGAFTSGPAGYGGYPGFYSASLGLYGEQGPAFLGVMFENNELFVGHVCQHGPAEAGGMLRGDRILAIDQQQFTNHAEFLAFMTSRAPLELVQVTVSRHDEPISLAVELGGLLTPDVLYGVDVDGILSETIADWSDQDVHAQDELGFLAGGEWKIIHVCPTDASWAAGMRRDDVLLAINDQKFADRAELTKFVGSLKAGDPLAVKVRRGDEELTFEWRFGAQSAGANLHQVAAAKPIVVLDRELAVARVDRSSEAYAAGLRTGDVVTYVNGRKLDSLNDAAAALAGADPARDRVHVVAMRGGEARSMLWKVTRPERSQ